MNQDFTVQKKAIFVWKKIRAEGLTWKKIPAQAISEKKNSCKLKIPPAPPPPHHFSNGPSLSAPPFIFLAALAVFDFSFDKHHGCSKSNFSCRENVSSQEPISGRVSARLHCDLCFLPPFSQSEGERLRERLVGERTCCPLFSSPPRVIWQLKCPTPDEVQEFASLPRSRFWDVTQPQKTAAMETILGICHPRQKKL